MRTVALLILMRFYRLEKLMKKIIALAREQSALFFLTKVFEDDPLIIGARLKAVDMLNKMYGDYRSDAILNNKAIEMPTINFILTDEDEKKI